jgi:excinuclease UvrABC nuclease subunit
MISEKLKNLISNLKHLPGVYLMHDKNDTIIYVGKAKDLQKRVSQYFKVTKAKKCQPRTLYPVKTSFKNHDEIKTVPHK